MTTEQPSEIVDLPFITSDYCRVPCSECGSLVVVPRRGYPVIRCSPLGYGHRVTVVHSGRDARRAPEVGS